METDTQGRYLIAKLLIEKIAFFLINIYAPNDYREQEQFIKMLSEYIAAKTDVLKVIIAGYWNTTLKQADKYGGIPWKETAYRNSIINLMEEFGLQDIYQKLHLNSKSFTYETKNLKLKSRIDFFLVSNLILLEVKMAEIRSSVELMLQTELEELNRKICNSTNMDLDQDVLEAYDAAKKD